MVKGDFSTIKKRTNNSSVDDFIGEAKVDGSAKSKATKTRRGGFKIDPVTGEKIKLGGKVLGVPLNEHELKTLTLAAEKAGLPVATFVRIAALREAKDNV